MLQHAGTTEANANNVRQQSIVSLPELVMVGLVCSKKRPGLTTGKAPWTSVPRSGTLSVPSARFQAIATRLEHRSRDRALTILEVLARDAPCSLHQLHERSGLPKSTIRRLLGTLRKRHFIRQGISDGLYRTNIALPWATDREHAATAARLVEVARPHMVRLTETMKWSSNLGIPRAGRWHVIESTRSISPYNIDRLKVLDHERNIFATATGLAYLSALDDVQVLETVRALHGDLQWGLKYVKIDESTLLRELKVVRA